MKKLRPRFGSISQGLVVAALALAVPAIASAAAAASRWNTNADNVVLDGYDVVAYHAEDRPVRGNAEHAVTHDGVKFYFASAENKAAFSQEPVPRHSDGT